MTDPVAELLREFSADRWRAHRYIFGHRHPEEGCAAHRDMVETIYLPAARVSIEGFRGLAKSTYLEEAAVLRAVYQEFGNMVVLGSSYIRACDRLTAIKRELEYNDIIADLFGPQKGSSWQEGKIILANGVCIQALGREQSMLGIKHLDKRPDACLIDDVEDSEEVRTDAEREKTWLWFLRTFLPSLDHPETSWVRMLATRRGSGSLPERVERAGWVVRKFPIEYIDEAGERCATWPGKFPLPSVDAIRAIYSGDMHTWAQEYMCQATSEADRVFSREQFVLKPREREPWHGVYAMIDPARTVGQKSATTGWAVWSWVKNRLVVWAADARRMLPDEIVDLAFTIAERFDPIEIGIEEDGLNEWLRQPLRHEMLRRRTYIPFAPIKAPRGKLGFIRGLQPYFNAREVEFVQDLPALQDQLISFPAGEIDAPNALAFAPLMHSGALVYDGFTEQHIIDDPDYARDRPLFLAANATGAMLTAVLAQIYDGRLVVLADWIIEGPPAEAVINLYEEAALAADSAKQVRLGGRERDWTKLLDASAVERTGLRRQPPVWVFPPKHAERYMNVGVAQAARMIPSEVRFGGEQVDGERWLREQLGRQVRGSLAVEVSAKALWTLRAFTGGYARGVNRGRLQEFAKEGPYRVLMEGLEAFVASSRLRLASSDDEEDMGDNYATDRHGRRYKSAMPARRG